MDERVAIITARGGSKRIPRKNLKLFLNRPIIEYSIEAALGCGLFSEVMVSTDDEDIAKIAIHAGAKVPFLRSKENSNDYAGTAEVICEVIETYRSLGNFFTIGCCIYPTAPFVTSDLLKSGLNLLIDKKYDVVFPVIPYSYPIQRSLRIIDGSRAEMIWPDNYTKRSQDLEAAYHDVGQFYWFNTDNIIKKRKLITDNFGVIKISELNAQDIDSECDWELAEIKYSLMLKRNNPSF